MLSEISGLIHHGAVFLPADPARSGRIALWQSDGKAARTDTGTGVGAGTGTGTDAVDPKSPVGKGRYEELTIITPDLRRATVVALVLSVDEALPLLTRARSAEADAEAAAGSGAGNEASGGSGTAFWGAAALLALRFAARGQLLPGLSPAGHDAWRIGPLEGSDLAEVRELAAAMPPAAHCVPLAPDGPARLPAPEPLLRAFLDAVADTLPRSPAAPAAAGGPDLPGVPPGHPKTYLR
ncbi:hypothetical protein [Streptomyces avidinii]